MYNFALFALLLGLVQPVPTYLIWILLATLFLVPILLLLFASIYLDLFLEINHQPLIHLLGIRFWWRWFSGEQNQILA